ncbi:MAG TPA: right-handed parallel beta-helix repeat-containing protein, partial [Bacteroidetes bacterium]|nr:right-handed parallel beta-helix repeat-containing protein [Bacteroidota bacterium]HEX04069.1 right-handed parallel beta-helix repeat-containing protein [Bacteroidota bacterium]
HPCSGVIDRGDPSWKDEDLTQADMGAIPLFQGKYDLSKRLVNDDVYNKLNLEEGMLYRVRCDIWVEEGDELIIGAGTMLAFEGPYSLYLRGGVQISGVEGNEVVFTSAALEPESADWRQIVLDEVDEGSFIEHAIIEYASLDNRSSPFPDTLGALTVIACSPRLDNITIRDSYYAGLHCFDGANPTVDRLTVERVGMHGVVCMLNSNPVLTRTRISDTRGYGILLVSNSSPDITNLLMYNIGGSGLYVTELSSPTINYATVYGKRIEVLGDEDGVERRFNHGIHAEGFAQPEVKNSIFYGYKSSGVFSEISSEPTLSYTYFFSDVDADLFVGPVDSTEVGSFEFSFVAPEEFDFTLPEGSPLLLGSDDGGEVGAYGNNGL